MKKLTLWEKFKRLVLEEHESMNKQYVAQKKLRDYEKKKEDEKTVHVLVFEVIQIKQKNGVRQSVRSLVNKQIEVYEDAVPGIIECYVQKIFPHKIPESEK